MRSVFYLLLLGVILATIAIVVRSGMLARHNPGRPINRAMREAMEGPQFSTEDAAIIATKYSTAHRLSSGLLYVVNAPGEGPTPTVGSVLTVNYDGRLLDGTQFDSSYNKGRPFTFRVGIGEVIKGWDEAFLQMRRGEKRTLIVPYWLGYGEASRGKIPARATLVFAVELLDIQ
jgi:FKBP-type peptidyl-prolyl cis-trans isomerase